MIRNTVVVAILAAGWCACSSAPAPAPDILGGPKQTRTLTYVHLAEEARNDTVKVYPIPDNMDALGVQGIIVSDTGTPTDNCFYDTGSCTGDIICFVYDGSGSRVATLSDYALGTGTWSGQIGSYVPHNDYGCLSNTLAPPITYHFFPKGATCVGGGPAYAKYVTIGSTVCPTSCGIGKFPCNLACSDQGGYYLEACFPNSDCPTGCNQNTWCFLHSGLSCPM